MSGIAGILRLDDRKPDGLDAMMDRVKHRGPEGVETFVDQIAGLGHAKLTATPEAANEVMPWVHDETGCAITADVRLDNRAVLIADLGLPDDGRPLGDGELILRAYLRWGDDCAVHLQGDFAFAIWDPRQQRMFCARDKMGGKPFFYAHVPGRVFAVGSSATTVVRAADVPKALNEGRVADYLEQGLAWIDFTCTFFKDVSRLPPRHTMVIDKQGARINQYWEMTPGPLLKLGSDQDYADAFREVFTTAVARCMRAPQDKLGVLLSGGMDSSAVAGTALTMMNGRPLPSYSIVDSGTPDCVETAAIYRAAAMPGIKPNFFDLATDGPWLAALGDDFRTLEDPIGIHASIVRGAYRGASQDGLAVVMDGGTGDAVLSEGDYIPNLMRSLSWRKALAEITEESAFHGVSDQLNRQIRFYAKKAVIPDWVRYLRWKYRQSFPDRSPSATISDSWAAHVDLGRRRARTMNPPWPGSIRQKRAHAMQTTNITMGREAYDREAGRVGVEVRDPFVDLDVMEFVLRLPVEQLMQNGWAKIIMRRAMRGLVPDSLCWRTGKEHLGPDLTQAVYDTYGPRDDFDVAWPTPPGSPFKSTSDDPESQMVGPLEKAVLKHWLRTQGLA